jgi:hypothetical protein
MPLPDHVVPTNQNTVPLAIFAVVLLFLLIGMTKAASRPSAAELASITDRGRLLAEYDKASWQATDAVMAFRPRAESSERYIARKTGAGWVVDFGRLSESRTKFLIAYEATQTGSSGRFEVKGFDPMREGEGWDLAAAKAIEIAMRDFHGADRPYNIAVLPAERGGEYVYLYPAQVKTGVYPLGADVRYLISTDGTRILEKRPMHKSVIEYGPSDSSGAVTAGYHSHVLSDLPEDTDVLLVLMRYPHVPEIVAAGAYIFTVDVNGVITVADRPK